jgi:hypothetical protein
MIGGHSVSNALTTTRRGTYAEQPERNGKRSLSFVPNRYGKALKK